MKSKLPTETAAIMTDENHEIDIIANMIKHAEAQGLLTEVIWSFAQDLYSAGKRNVDYTQAINEAASFGLNEWDC